MGAISRRKRPPAKFMLRKKAADRMPKGKVRHGHGGEYVALIALILKGGGRVTRAVTPADHRIGSRIPECTKGYPVCSSQLSTACGLKCVNTAVRTPHIPSPTRAACESHTSAEC